MLIRKGSDRAFVRSVNTPFLFCAFVYVLALSSSCAIFFSKRLRLFMSSSSVCR